MRTNQKCFTLIEIMTVIAIIAILSGILFPVLGTIQERSKVSETQTIVVGVKTAIDMFAMSNNYLPYPGESTDDDKAIDGWKSGQNNINQMTPDAEYYDFFDILTYSNHTNSSSSPAEKIKSYNPKHERYLDAPKRYFTNSKNSDQYKDSIRDSWNRPLYIVLDLNQDGKVEVTKKYNIEGNFVTSAVVFSLGSQDSEKISKADVNEYISSIGD